MGPIEDQAAIEKVRWFLASLEPGELRRLIECFRMQMGLPPIPEQVAPVLSPGLQKRLPGTGMLRSLAARLGN